jgi:hypothetical protein
VVYVVWQIRARCWNGENCFGTAGLSSHTPTMQSPHHNFGNACLQAFAAIELLMGGGATAIISCPPSCISTHCIYHLTHLPIFIPITSIDDCISVLVEDQWETSAHDWLNVRL